LERLVVALLARGHILVEGVPGLAKTMAIKTLAEAIGGEFKRIQSRPISCPPTSSARASTIKRPASSIPRSARSSLTAAGRRDQPRARQSAERAARSHAGAPGHHRGQTYKVPNPFLVLATQNPIETEGTYPLPEAQVDRFMLKVVVGYPSPTEEFVIVERMIGVLQAVQKVLSTEQNCWSCKGQPTRFMSTHR